VSINSSYVTGKNNSLTTAIALNNLMSIDEVLGIARLDIYFRLYWEEPRMNVSNLFRALDAINPHIKDEGIEMVNLFRGPNGYDSVFLETCTFENLR